MIPARILNDCILILKDCFFGQYLLKNQCWRTSAGDGFFFKQKPENKTGNPNHSCKKQTLIQVARQCM